MAPRPGSTRRACHPCEYPARLQPSRGPRELNLHRQNPITTGRHAPRGHSSTPRQGSPGPCYSSYVLRYFATAACAAATLPAGLCGARAPGAREVWSSRACSDRPAGTHTARTQGWYCSQSRSSVQSVVHFRPQTPLQPPPYAAQPAGASALRMSGVSPSAGAPPRCRYARTSSPACSRASSLNLHRSACAQQKPPSYACSTFSPSIHAPTITSSLLYTCTNAPDIPQALSPDDCGKPTHVRLQRMAHACFIQLTKRSARFHSNARISALWECSNFSTRRAIPTPLSALVHATATAPRIHALTAGHTAVCADALATRCTMGSTTLTAPPIDVVDVVAQQPLTKHEEATGRAGGQGGRSGREALSWDWSPHSYSLTPYFTVAGLNGVAVGGRGDPGAHSKDVREASNVQRNRAGDGVAVGRGV